MGPSPPPSPPSWGRPFAAFQEIWVANNGSHYGGSPWVPPFAVRVPRPGEDAADDRPPPAGWLPAGWGPPPLPGQGQAQTGDAAGGEESDGFFRCGEVADCLPRVLRLRGHRNLPGDDHILSEELALAFADQVLFSSVFTAGGYAFGGHNSLAIMRAVSPHWIEDSHTLVKPARRAAAASGSVSTSASSPSPSSSSSSGGKAEEPLASPSDEASSSSATPADSGASGDVGPPPPAPPAVGLGPPPPPVPVLGGFGGGASVGDIGVPKHTAGDHGGAHFFAPRASTAATGDVELEFWTEHTTCGWDSPMQADFELRQLAFSSAGDLKSNEVVYHYQTSTARPPMGPPPVG